MPTGAGQGDLEMKKFLTAILFAPVLLVVRDAAGLLGLTALGAATISTARAWPVWIAVVAAWMPKVAEEQATFMSKAKPSMPSACCTSMAMAG